MMFIRFATVEDFPAWCTLATEVSPIFFHPADMGKNPEFLAYVANKSRQSEALTAVDESSGVCMGFIGFSRTHNRISWFAVSDKWRGKGAGERLLRAALYQLDPTRPITVDTFREGYEPGIPAKNLYRKCGFVETDERITSPHGEPICRMVADFSA